MISTLEKKAPLTITHYKITSVLDGLSPERLLSASRQPMRGLLKSFVRSQTVQVGSMSISILSALDNYERSELPPRAAKGETMTLVDRSNW